MLNSIRCAACGSPHVKSDEHSEGYSIAKGIAGTQELWHLAQWELLLG